MANADRLINLLHEAKARSAGAEREQFLAEACGDDEALKQQIVSLLEADAAEGESNFLKSTRKIRPDIALTEKPGDRISRYKLLEQIGEGGCGVVYLAEQEEPVRRRVALKVIKLGMDTKQVIARFDAERQALAIMDHPNIAKVLDAGATGTGRPYFVMELVRGIKITDYCDQHQLSPRQRLELFMQVCGAIQHAHQKGVMHRDIKPSNILVASNDGAPVPKVIDFGIAKATQGRLTNQTVYTALEQFIGTPAYMSPEQAEMSLNEVDTRTDIYSLGVLLYELLTGKTPFDAKELVAAGLEAMRRTIREKEPARPSTRLSTMMEGELTSTAKQRHTEATRLIHLLRGDLDWIVMKCLEKDRGRRYETANGLAADIQRHLNFEVVQARPPSRLYEFQRTVRRHKFGFAAATSVMLALLIGALVNTWQYHREKAARERAVTAERRQTELLGQAEVLRAQAESEAYASDMAFASAAVAGGKSLGGVDALLSRWKDHSPDLRGWEWYYLNGICHRERVSMTAGSGMQYTVAWHPDGIRLASGGEDGIIRIWNGRIGRRLLEFPGSTGEINGIAWSPDGRRLATAADGEAVQIWDPELGTEITRFRGHTNRVYSVAWSPDGQEILSAGEDAVIRLWNVNSGSLLRTWKASGSLVSLAWNHDGSRFASCGTNGTNEGVQIWDPHATGTGEHRDQPVSKIFTGKCRQVEWSPDGQRLAAITDPDHLLIFDPNAGVLAARFQTNVWGVGCLAWSPNGRFLATGNLGDGFVRVFESLTGRLFQTFRGHRGTVSSLAWTPDSKEVASVGSAGTVKIWEVGQQRSANTVVQRQGQTYSFDWHPDGRHLLQGNTEGSLWVWDSTSWADPIHLQASTSWVFRVAWNPSGTRFASASEDGFIRIWDWPGCKLLLSLRDHHGDARGLAWSRDGRRIAALYSGADDGFEIWDADTGTVLASQPHHGLALALSPDGQHFAAAERSVLVILDARTGNEVLRLGKHRAGIRQIAWRRDGRQLATASDDNTVKIWDLVAAKEVRTLEAFGHKVYGVDWNPDGTRLATADQVGQVSIWNPATGRLVCFTANEGPWLFCVKWNPDGKRLAASSINGEIIQFDATAGYEVERKQSALK